MAEFTPNYQFEKPSNEEKYFIHKFNQNFQKVDDALKNHDDTMDANRTQEEEDINDLRTEVEGYADNAVSAHNLSTDINLHPHLQAKISDALQEAKDYAYSKEETDNAIAIHDADPSAHQDIRDSINNIDYVTDTKISNAIDLHNADIESHPDIRSDINSSREYSEQILAEHNADPNAHGGKFEIIGISNNNFESGTLDKTWEEITSGFNNVRNTILKLGPVDVKINSFNTVLNELYGSYYDNYDEHLVILFLNKNDIPSFVNNSIWDVSAYVDYGRANYMTLRT